jgi:hypothetical protein
VSERIVLGRGSTVLLGSYLPHTPLHFEFADRQNLEFDACDRAQSAGNVACFCSLLHQCYCWRMSPASACCLPHHKLFVVLAFLSLRSCCSYCSKWVWVVPCNQDSMQDLQLWKSMLILSVQALELCLVCLNTCPLYGWQIAADAFAPHAPLRSQHTVVHSICKCRGGKELTQLLDRLEIPMYLQTGHCSSIAAVQATPRIQSNIVKSCSWPK